MQHSKFSLSSYKKAPVVGIVRGLETEKVYKIAEVYLEAGFTTIEITMNTENVADIINNLSSKFPELNVGAGTVCTTQDLDLALDAGSQFIVTPIISADIIRATVAKEIPIFPGAYTPTEIYTAWSLGATAVKVFPATQLGIQYLKDVSAPLNQIKLLPTGGVSSKNIKSFFEAGAYGVGMGSSLLDKEALKNNDYVSLKKHLLSIREQIIDYIPS